MQGPSDDIAALGFEPIDFGDPLGDGAASALAHPEEADHGLAVLPLQSYMM